MIINDRRVDTGGNIMMVELVQNGERVDMKQLGDHDDVFFL